MRTLRSSSLIPLLATCPPLLAQCELQQLAPEDLSISSLLGASISVLGDQLVAGAPYADGAAGLVYTFGLTDSGWQETGSLPSSTPEFEGGFGFCVALEGSWMFVGAPLEDTPLGGEDSGAVHVFQDGGEWALMDRLVPVEASAGAQFGDALAIDGNTAVIGAPLEAATHPFGGAVYVFESGEEGWAQTARLVPSDPAIFHHFGSSVAVSGDTILVGAEWDSETGFRHGAVYVFERSGRTWYQAAKHTIPSFNDARLGAALAFDGTHWIAGAPASFSTPYAAVFGRDGDEWVEVARLTGHDSAPADRFAGSVAIDGGRALVGASQSGSGGATYVFEEEAGEWSEVMRIVPADMSPGDRFGVSVGLSGGRAIMGAERDATGAFFGGAVYVYDVEARAVSYCSSAPNSSGDSASIGTSGSLSIARNDFALVAESCPPETFGLFLAGQGQSDLPFGNGRLCVSPFAPGLVRLLPILETGANGQALRELALEDTTDLPAGAGTSWNFQFWFRDPTAGSSGTFDLSDAVHVVFCD